MISKYLTWSLLGLLLFTLACKAGKTSNPDKQEQSQVGMTPAVFAPGIVSLPGESEFGSVLTADGKECYYGVDINGRTEIRHTRLEKGNWTTPQVVISHAVYGYNDPFLSPDEQKLYFISDQPADAKGDKKDHDILYIEKTKDGWSKPISAGPSINSKRNEYYMSFTADGTMYFSSNVKAPRDRGNDYDIYAAKAKKGGGFEQAVSLPDAINTAYYEADVFIAYDESYMIFCSIRKGGLGRGDLYISFKDEQGEWMPAVNMGTEINSENHELCPFVSKDGKYFFYTSNQDIYWVDAKIIPALRSQFRQKK